MRKYNKSQIADDIVREYRRKQKWEEYLKRKAEEKEEQNKIEENKE